MRHLGSLPLEVQEALQAFLQRLKEADPDARVYLYGSFARGDWLEDSDVDIVVVSSTFHDEHLVDRMAKLRRLAPFTVSFEILGYTPQEMEEKLQTSFIWQEIASYWIELT